MIPAPLPALGREGGAQHSGSASFGSQQGKGGGLSPWGGKGEGGRAGPLCSPWLGWLQRAEPYVSVQGAQDMSQQRLLGAGLGLPLKSLP